MIEQQQEDVVDILLDTSVLACGPSLCLGSNQGCFAPKTTGRGKRASFSQNTRQQPGRVATPPPTAPNLGCKGRVQKTPAAAAPIVDAMRRLLAACDPLLSGTLSAQKTQTPTPRLIFTHLGFLVGFFPPTALLAVCFRRPMATGSTEPCCS